MNIVQKLDESLSNQIAAGEVVERPAAVVKELVENAIDAGARRIEIELEDGGKRRIVVSDDGKGMSREDALLALERHTTSKLRSHEDLFDIHTFGFRGEAIPSIASVSRFTLTTRREQDLAACKIEVEGGKVIEVSEAGAPVGTRIEVDDLFFNVPARQKFLKARATEVGHINEWLTRLAMCEPQIAFVMTEKGRVLLRADASSKLKERIVSLLGRDFHENLFEVDNEHQGIRVHGLVAGPKKTSQNTRNIYTFVNGRFVRDRGLIFSVLRAYEGVLGVGRSPNCVLFIELAPDQVDVNVHPQKMEVRFNNSREVNNAVVAAIRPVLAASPWNTAKQMVPTRHYSLKSGGTNAGSAGAVGGGAEARGGAGVGGESPGSAAASGLQSERPHAPGSPDSPDSSPALGISRDSDPRLASGSQSAGQRFSDALFGAPAETSGAAHRSSFSGSAHPAPDHASRIARAAAGWLGPAPELGSAASFRGASGSASGAVSKDLSGELSKNFSGDLSGDLSGNTDEPGEALALSDSEVAEKEATASDALLAELENEPGLQVGGRLWQAMSAMKEQSRQAAQARAGAHNLDGGEASGVQGEGGERSGVEGSAAQTRSGPLQGELLSGGAGADLSASSVEDASSSEALRFSELRYLGQIMRTFLVCESPQGLVLLDQHAAHERVLYEQLRERQREEKPKSTALLVPHTIHLSAAESALLEGVLDELAELGFELEDFGGNSWALKAYPSDIDEKNLEELVRELALEIQSFGGGLSRDQSKEALLIRTSCHSAVRSGDVMQPQEVTALLKSLDGVPFNAQCPHGRPVAVVFDAKALDLMFRRDYEGTSKGAARDRLGC